MGWPTAGRVLAVASAVPALVLAGWLLAGVPLLLLGRFGPVQMILLGVALAFLLCRYGLRRMPETVEATARQTAALLGIALAAGIFNAVLHTEQFMVRRDPATYAQYAIWLATDGTLPIPTDVAAFGGPDPALRFDSVGFYGVGPDGASSVDDEHAAVQGPGWGIQPQFMPGTPIIHAFGHWMGGVPGLMLMPPILGALAVLTFGGTVARLVGARWAVAAAAALAVSLPILYTSRAAFSETCSMILLLGAINLLLDARYRLRAGLLGVGFLPADSAPLPEENVGPVAAVRRWLARRGAGATGDRDARAAGDAAGHSGENLAGAPAEGAARGAAGGTAKGAAGGSAEGSTGSSVADSTKSPAADSAGEVAGAKLRGAGLSRALVVTRAIQAGDAAVVAALAGLVFGLALLVRVDALRDVLPVLAYAGMLIALHRYRSRLRAGRAARSAAAPGTSLRPRSSETFAFHERRKGVAAGGDTVSAHSSVTLDASAAAHVRGGTNGSRAGTGGAASSESPDSSDTSDGRLGWPLLGGLLVGAGIGFLAAYLLARPYLVDLSDSLRPLLAICAGVVLLTVLGAALAPRLGGRVARLVRRPSASVARRVPAMAAGLVAAGVAALAVRPWVQTVHRVPGTPEDMLTADFIARTQAANGLPEDSTRLYYEESLYWVIWYVGVPVVVFATLAAALLTYYLGRGRGFVWLLPLAIIVWTTATTLWRPGITPDHPFASRRLVPIVIPGLILLAAWGLRWVRARMRRAGHGRARQNALLVVGVLLLVVPGAVTSIGTAFTPVGRGEAAAVARLCGSLPRDAAVLIIERVTGDRFTQLVRGMCGRPTARIAVAPGTDLAPPNDVTRLVARVRAAERTPVLLAAEHPQLSPYGTPTLAFSVRTRQDERSLVSPPDGTWTLAADVWMTVP